MIDEKQILRWISESELERYIKLPNLIIVESIEDAEELSRKLAPEQYLILHSPDIIDSRKKEMHEIREPTISLKDGKEFKGILINAENIRNAMADLYKEWAEPPKNLTQTLDSLEESVERSAKKRQKDLDVLEHAAQTLASHGNNDQAQVISLIRQITKTQFEHPEHFIREAIQNADGSSEEKEKNRIDVYIDREKKAVTIEDQGRGMTQEIMDDKFFNLYASINEGLSYAAGKFGIGAVSFFGLGHEYVEVDSKPLEGEGGSARVDAELNREYDFKPTKREAHGTTITIKLSERSDVDFDKVIEILEKDCSYIKTPLYLHQNSQEKRLNRQLNPSSSDTISFKEKNIEGFVQRTGNGGSLDLLDHRIRLRTILTRGYRGAVDCPGLDTTFSRDSVVEDPVLRHVLAYVEGKSKELYMNDSEDITSLSLEDRLRRYHAFIMESIFNSEEKANEPWIKKNLYKLEKRATFIPKKERYDISRWNFVGGLAFLPLAVIGPTIIGSTVDIVYNSGLIAESYVRSAVISIKDKIRRACRKYKTSDAVTDNKETQESILEKLLEEKTKRKDYFREMKKNTYSALTLKYIKDSFEEDPFIQKEFIAIENIAKGAAAILVNTVIGTLSSCICYSQGYQTAASMIFKSSLAYSSIILASILGNTAASELNKVVNFADGLWQRYRERLLDKIINEKNEEIYKGFEDSSKEVRYYLKRVQQKTENKRLEEGMISTAEPKTKKQSLKQYFTDLKKISIDNLVEGVRSIQNTARSVAGSLKEAYSSFSLYDTLLRIKEGAINTSKMIYDKSKEIAKDAALPLLITAPILATLVYTFPAERIFPKINRPDIIRYADTPQNSSTRYMPMIISNKGAHTETRESLADHLNSCGTGSAAPGYVSQSRNNRLSFTGEYIWEDNSSVTGLSIDDKIDIGLPKELESLIDKTLEDKIVGVFRYMSGFEYDAITEDDVKKHGDKLKAAIIERKAVCNSANTLAAIFLHRLGVSQIRYNSGLLNGSPHGWLEINIAGQWRIADFTPERINQELAAKINPLSNALLPYGSEENIFSRRYITRNDPTPSKDKSTIGFSPTFGSLFEGKSTLGAYVSIEEMVSDLKGHRVNIPSHSALTQLFVKINKGDSRYKLATAIKNISGCSMSWQDIASMIPINQQGYLRTGLYHIGSIKNNSLGTTENISLMIADKISYFEIAKIEDRKQITPNTDDKDNDAQVTSLIDRINLERDLIPVQTIPVQTVQMQKKSEDPHIPASTDKPKETASPLPTDTYVPQPALDKQEIQSQYTQEHATPQTEDKKQNEQPYSGALWYILGALGIGSFFMRRKDDKIKELTAQQKEIRRRIKTSIPNIDVYYSSSLNEPFYVSSDKIILNPEIDIIPEIVVLKYATQANDISLARKITSSYRGRT